MADASGSDNFIAKIVGGVFATVIAPIVVAIGVKWFDNDPPPVADPHKPEASVTAKPDSPAAAQPNAAGAAAIGSAAATRGSDTAKPAGPKTDANLANDKPNVGGRQGKRQGPQANPATAMANNAPQSVARPAEAPMVRLFNGIDKTGFYTWLGPPKPKAKPIGKNRDPDKQFTIEGGVLHIGGPTDGGLVTEKEYGNYHLEVFYRWGDKTWPANAPRARQGGILLHCTGADGAIHGRMMHSVRCALNEGHAGSLWMLGSNPKNPISFTVTAEKHIVRDGDKTDVRFRYNPAQALTALTGGNVSPLGHDLNSKNVKGFRGKNTQEKPVGKWNHLECICDGGKITVRLNGTTVNEIDDLSVRKGKIMVQSLGAELFIRSITLKPLTSVAAAGKL